MISVYVPAVSPQEKEALWLIKEEARCAVESIGSFGEEKNLLPQSIFETGDSRSLRSPFDAKYRRSTIKSSVLL
jgi:hypothetical protein